MKLVQVIRTFAERSSGQRQASHAMPVANVRAATCKYAQAGVEPSLDEALEDPIVRLRMHADRLDPAEVRRLVMAVQLL